MLGERRTPDQDVPYALQQLAEVAIRALSPGINAPFTALPAIDTLGAALTALAGRQMPALIRYDADNRLRVVVRRGLSLAEIVRDALGPLASAARAYNFVVARVIEVVLLVADRAPLAADRDRLRALADEIAAEADAALRSGRERRHVSARIEAMRTAPDEPKRSDV